MTRHLARLALGSLAVLLDATAGAAQVTFTRDVAPILHAKCVTCHRAGQATPMALESYEQARPWARSVKEKVAARSMPPWFARRGVGAFANDPSLTAQEIATISAWVDAGAPQGDPADMPAAPLFSDDWQLGTPDYVLDLPAVDVPPTGGDFNPSFTVSVNLPEDRWVRAVEIQPGDRAVTHHAALYTVGNGDSSGARELFASWAVGSLAMSYPEGLGRPLLKGQAIRADMHYHPNGQATTDRTRVALYFGRGPLKKEVVSGSIGNLTFKIPPKTDDYEVAASSIVDQDITVLWLGAHMHLRGKAMEFTATFPDGRREVLLDVQGYDFKWQLPYYPRVPVRLPRGTQIDVVARYDNTSANRRNPDANRAVPFGDSTADEMMFGVFEFIADATARPTPSSARTRMEAMLPTLPAESAYMVDVGTKEKSVPSLLHLPKGGEGRWYLDQSIEGFPTETVVVAPVRNVRWTGNSVAFAVDLEPDRPGGEAVVIGTVGPEGSIRGTLRANGDEIAPLPFTEFAGRKAGTVPPR